MNLSNQIRGRINRGKSIENDKDQSMIAIHHILMTAYGWIPLKEFKKLPLPTMYNLLHYIGKDKEAERQAYKK